MQVESGQICAACGSVAKPATLSIRLKANVLGTNPLDRILNKSYLETDFHEA